MENTHLLRCTGSDGERLNCSTGLTICGQQSGITSHIEHRSFKRPRILERTTSDGEIPHKTEPCPKFQMADFNHGHSLYYAHRTGGFPQVRMSNRQELLATEDGYPCSKRDEKPRPMTGMNLWWKSCNGEECPWGDNCHFPHQKVEERKGNMGLDRKTVPRSIFNGSEAEGGCRSGLGKLERFLWRNSLSANHVYLKPAAWKTRICNKWLATGSCSYGLKCYFAHGESELQKRGPHDVRRCADKAFLSLAVDASGEGIGNPQRVKVQGEHRVFNWKDIRKISRVYADWIDDLPLVRG